LNNVDDDCCVDGGIVTFPLPIFGHPLVKMNIRPVEHVVVVVVAVLLLDDSDDSVDIK